MAQMTALSSFASADYAAVLPADQPAAKATPAEANPFVGRIAKLPEKQGEPVKQEAPATSLSSSDQSSIVNQLNKTLEAFDTHVSLSVDEKSHRNVIKVIDNQSGKVIRQIPSEQLLRISDRITELLGVLYDEKF